MPQPNARPHGAQSPSVPTDGVLAPCACHVARRACHTYCQVLFWGEPLLPIFPRASSSCLSYVAPPLELPQITEPTPAQVDEWHARYLQALRELFDASKAEAGQPDAILEIW